MKRLAHVKNLVVKVGTSTLTTPEGQTDHGYFLRLAEQLTMARKSRRNVALVSSGAIRTGLVALGLSGKAKRLDLPEKQAAAAVGQGLLMHTYSQAFARFDQQVAQILLTRADMEARDRFLNARNTIHTLFDLGIIPIVNENDTVSVDEIKFGDNDNLAALVSILVDADLLVLLTNVDGFYAGDAKDSQPIARIDRITREIEASVHNQISNGGTGGMHSKLDAAKKVSTSGIPMVIANGRCPDVVTRILSGEPLGTFFAASTERAGSGRLTSRKKWIAYGRKPRGEIVVNEGARRSIVEHGKSLLPVGIVEVCGEFSGGEMVSLSEASVGEFARGLVNYSSEAIGKIAGLRTSQIEKALGYRDFDEVVHRDNLTMTDWSNVVVE